MNTVEIVFSPTGGTRKVAQIIGAQLSENPRIIDLADANRDFAKCEIGPRDMALVAMPSFGGRAPAIAVERLKKIRGNGARCAVVCVYGNRAYEDTLIEMLDAASACGFVVTAAVSAVAQHSIIPRYAAGRPDERDKKELTEFAGQISGKTTPLSSVPGRRPYKKAFSAALVPKLGKSCVKCGLCAKKCPVQAIDYVKLVADAKKCVSCMRCVKLCPKNNRKLNRLIVSLAALAIKKECSKRKENELFL